MPTKHDIIKSLIVGWSLIDLCWTWGATARLAAAAASDESGYLRTFVCAGDTRRTLLLLFFLTALIVKFDWDRPFRRGLLPSIWALIYGIAGLLNFRLTYLVLLENEAGPLILRNWFWLQEYGVRAFPRFICGVALFLYSVAGLRGWLKSSKNTQAT